MGRSLNLESLLGVPFFIRVPYYVGELKRDRP